jgi:hypothetical protein
MMQKNCAKTLAFLSLLGGSQSNSDFMSLSIKNSSILRTKTNKDPYRRERERVRERERERERSFLTINSCLKVGKYNALSGDTASGRSGPSI